jgi:3-hydroxyacyl-CoA dehydrogenase
MRERDIAIAPWVEDMLARGGESFYRRENGRIVSVWNPMDAQYVAYTPPEGVLSLDDLRAQGKEVARNHSASLIDLGDGVLCFEFHAKVNAIDPLITEMGWKALELLQDDRWVGMVIGNQSSDFCAGVNLGVVLMGVMGGKPEESAKFAKGTQDLFFRFRTCPKPIVAAPYGRVLGGGVEVCLAAARRVAAAETYMGLVELGVGLIPAWGGCKEFVRRHVSPHVRTPGADPLPYLQQAFETIAMAKVSELGAVQAKQLGYLMDDDKIVMNRERLIAEAKKEVLLMVAEGYTPVPPEGEPVYAIGRRGIAAVNAMVYGMRQGGYISDYDMKLARALAYVMCGGDLTQPQWVTEQYFLDLEFEQASQLIQQPKTQERIMAILQTGKPLRN